MRMGIPIRELQERISAREFAEYIAFWQLEPWGEEREDYRSALICAVLANVWRPKGSRDYRPEDFMPKFVPVEQSPEEQLRQVEIMNIIFGGRDMRERSGDSS